MTNTEIIQAIRNEIERRIKIQEYWVGKTLPGTELAFAIKEELKQLISFLSTLESEKPVTADLEEAAKDYTDSSEWLVGENLEHIEAAFIAGAKWQKEQTMKEAVNTVVSLEAGGFPFVEFGVSRFGLKVGDKVRVIIIKKEDEK